MLDAMLPPDEGGGSVPSGEGGIVVYEATVSSVTSDGVMVTIPDYDPHRVWGPCPFTRSIAPQRGDRCLVAFDSRRQPWVVAWPDGVRPALPEGGLHGQKLRRYSTDQYVWAERTQRVVLDDWYTGSVATFVGLRGNTDRLYEVLLEGYVNYDGGASATQNGFVFLRLNGQATNVYAGVSHVTYIDENGTVHQAGNMATYTPFTLGVHGIPIARTDWLLDGSAVGRATIQAARYTGLYRSIHSQHVFRPIYPTFGRASQLQHAAYWSNTTDELTSIEFYAWNCEFRGSIALRTVD